MVDTYNFYVALTPLLHALGWHGESRRIVEALPYLNKHLSIDDFRNVMANLGFDSKSVPISNKHIRKDLAPSLFVTYESAWIIHEDDHGTLVMTDCKSGESQPLSKAYRTRGTLYHFFTKPPVPLTHNLWLWVIFKRFHSYIYWLLGLGLVSSLLGLASFLFVTLVYDWVVPTRSPETLYYLLIGVMIALFCIEFIHIIQNKALSYLGARLDIIIGQEVIRQVLSLPPYLVEGSSVADQVTRIRQFDSIRDTFTGSFAKLLIELPFLFVFIIIMAFVAGPIALVPLVTIVIFVIVAILMYPSLRNSTREVSNASQNRRRFLLEGTSQLMTIKHLGAQEIWVNRYKQMGSNLAMVQKQNERLSAFSLNMSLSIMKIAGLTTIVWGTMRVMENSMSTGSLIGIVMLIWRALSPIQTAFMLLSRADQIIDSFNQVNRLMSQPTEKRSQAPHVPQVEGHLRLNAISFRYPNEGNSAISGVTLEAKPGEMVAIIGANGSGKSTLIKLMLGFFYPQGGSITLDGIDLRQYDPMGLRQAIAYVPQQNQFFHGTIAQNLRLCEPNATEEEMIHAAEMAGLLPDILNLPDGFETQLTDRILSIFSSGFLQKLNLARAFIRNSSLLILDEPGNTLDYESDTHLKTVLEGLKGKRTMIVATHRPSFMKLSNRLLVMKEGQMIVFGPTDLVLEEMSKHNV